MKLNLGCGNNKKPGFINVDKFGDPDVLFDLEVFPWPWPDSSIDEIFARHSLEHMGQTTDAFIGIMKEIYRVCKNGAVIRVIVPHPRHDTFLHDPTHVRALFPETFQLFSKENNQLWKEMGVANTPLGFYHNVDFSVKRVILGLDSVYSELYNDGKGVMSASEVEECIKKYNNVVAEIDIEMTIIK